MCRYADGHEQQLLCSLIKLPERNTRVTALWR